MAELSAQADRQSLNVADFLPREVWSLGVTLERVLDLTDEVVLDQAGLTAGDLVQPDYGFTRQIGEAAHERGYQAMRSYSARGVDEIVALFIENLGTASIAVDLVRRWEKPSDLD